MSALLTTTMPEMRKVIGALTQVGSRETVKVIVGGAPVNKNFANDIGADGYAKDAAEAIDLVRSLIVMKTVDSSSPCGRGHERRERTS